VVIAIIGILSSVVLASLNTARGKGANAAVKSNLVNIRPQAEIFYDGGLTYSGVCADATVARALDAASQAGAGNTSSDFCYATASTWAASSPLKVNEGTFTHWCVDHTGASTGRTSGLSGTPANC